MGADAEEKSEIQTVSNIRKYGLFSLVCLVVVALYLLTREKHTESDMLLSRVYMDKYRELESLLVEKDLALNETYMALQKTYSANKMQEETLKDLQLQLKELAPLHEAGDQLEVETAKSSFLLEDKNQAEMTAAMCRQEAAAAVQEKENQIWQHQQALERAREDVDELQRVVKEREGVLYQREMKLVATAHDMRGKLQSTSERLNDREKSIHWLAERKRLDNEQHTKALVAAKTDRECHSDITILRNELNTALAKHRQLEIMHDIKKNHKEGPGGWSETSQLPHVKGLPDPAPSPRDTPAPAPKAQPSMRGHALSRNAYLAAKQG